MATELLRPSSNITTGWSASGYTKINDSVTQPTAPSTSAGTFIQTNKNDDGEEDQYGFTAPATSGTLTNATLWVYGWMYTWSSNPYTTRQVRIRLNGSWTSYANWSGAHAVDGSPSISPDWSSYSWTVSGNAIGSAPAVGFKNAATVGIGEDWYIYAAYLILTTSGGVSGSLRRKRTLLTYFANMG